MKGPTVVNRRGDAIPCDGDFQNPSKNRAENRSNRASARKFIKLSSTVTFGRKRETPVEQRGQYPPCLSRVRTKQSLQIDGMRVSRVDDFLSVE